MCLECGGSVVQKRKYLPDFWLSELKFYIEVKGRLDSSTRKKMRDILKSNPSLDVRMLLMADNKIAPKNPMRYSEWCIKNGIKYAIKTIPEEWLK